jgi:lysylphosphatidylglycerol synthetase-like protein (DUF2156 family)
MKFRSKSVFVILVSTAVVCAGLAIFLWTQGLDRADKLASVLALFAGIIVAVISYLAKPRPQEPSQAQVANIPEAAAGSRYSVSITAKKIRRVSIGNDPAK